MPINILYFLLSAVYGSRSGHGSDFISILLASLIIGGWGGGVYGVSNLDGLSAVENETTGYVAFENDRWYRIELKVAKPRTTVTLDGEKIIDIETGAHQYAVWPEQASMIPLGIATWNTAAEIRGLELIQD